MNEILVMSVLVALMASFVVLLMKKWGVTEYMQVHGKGLLPELFSCDLCLSFWTSVVITAILSVSVREPWMLTIPVLSTPLARQMV